MKKNENAILVKPQKEMCNPRVIKTQRQLQREFNSLLRDMRELVKSLPFAISDAGFFQIIATLHALYPVGCAYAQMVGMRTMAGRAMMKRLHKIADMKDIEQIKRQREICDSAFAILKCGLDL